MSDVVPAVVLPGRLQLHVTDFCNENKHLVFASEVINKNLQPLVLFS